MTFEKYGTKLLTLQEYIQKNWATTPSQLAKKLGISERTVLRMIHFLKKHKVPVRYCKKIKGYKIISS